MNLLKVLAESVYPSDIKCVVCGGELNRDTRYMLCDDCQLDSNLKFCESCGRGIGGDGNLCDKCYEHNNKFAAARSSFIFSGSVPQLVHRFKYGNARYLASTMTEFMLDTFFQSKWNVDIITFVPIHKKRLKERGYNQAKLLADSFAPNVELECLELLEKTKYTKNMAKLNAEQRASLIKDSFELIGGTNLKGKNVLLIDDVLTTGATANECAQLLNSKCAEVYVLTFASVKMKAHLEYNATGIIKIK